MPNTNEVSAGSNNERTVAKTREDQLLAMRNLGGAPAGSSLVLPLLKLEHTILQGGEKNPDAGMFTLARRDGLGDWKKEVIGEEVTIHFLLQRYKLSLTENSISYSSPEFDNPHEIVRLWKSTGAGDDRKSELFAEGTPAELSSKFLITKNNRTFSQLKLLVVLYGKLDNGELVKWSTNVSGTVGYQKFARKTTPFAVITHITRVEATSGSNKYFQPKFQVLSEVEDFEKVLNDQQALKSSIQVGTESVVNEVMGTGEEE